MPSVSPTLRVSRSSSPTSSSCPHLHGELTADANLFKKAFEDARENNVKLSKGEKIEKKAPIAEEKKDEAPAAEEKKDDAPAADKKEEAKEAPKEEA